MISSLIASGTAVSDAGLSSGSEASGGDISSRWASARSGIRVSATSVANVRIFRNSRLRSSTTCLIRKLPKETPRSPAWQFVIE